MKKLFTLALAGSLCASFALADELVLPAGMTPLLPSGVEITSSYLAQNVVSITKDEKPLVVTAGNLIFFTASSAAAGEELWVSDGTPAGTRMVKDIVPGSEGCDPKWLTVLGDKVFFSANTPEYGPELWVSDGTDAGTHLVKNIYDVEPGVGSAPQGLTAFYGKLLFFAMDEESEALPVRDASTPEKWLWITDGTPEGTMRIADTPTRLDNMDGTHGYIVCCNGKGLFAGYDEENNETLWATDGTSAGTAPLLNINPKPGDANPFLTMPATIDHLVAVDDRLVVFRAVVAAELYGEDMGVEMWVSDGTAAGTKFIGVDINKVEKSGAPGTSDFRQTYPVGNRLYFRAADGVNGAESWCYDIDQPVAEGVNPCLVKEVSHYKNKVSYNAHPSCFYQYQGYIYVATNFTYEREEGGKKVLWNSGYHSLARFNENDFNEFEGALTWGGFEIYPNTNENGQEFCHQFTTVNDIMFWSCQDTDDNIELWKLEGTNGVPTKVVDFPDNGQVHKTRSVGGSLFFVSNGQKQLYRYNTDGSTDNPSVAGIGEIAAEAAPVVVAEGNTLIVVAPQGVRSLEIISMSGAVVSSRSGENSISTAGFAPGVYVLCATMTDGSRIHHKFAAR